MRYNRILILLALLFLFTRLYNLTLLPIFTDESIYIYWAKYIVAHHSNWFISLTDGKPPLLIWIIVLFLKIFPSSLYLFAARLVSVVAGGITLFGMYKLSLLLFGSKKAALFSVFLAVINPFMLFYDKLALYDSFLSAMLVWSVYYMVKTSVTYAKKDALLWGLFLGLGLLTKPPAIIFLILTPVCFLLLTFKKKGNLKKIFLLLLLALVLGEALNNLQNFSINYKLMVIKNQHFQIPFSEILSDPFTIVSKNIRELLSWVISYYTFPLFLVGCIGLSLIVYKNIKKGLILLLLWIVPIFVFAIVGQILFPRYILFTTPYFLIGLSEGLRILSFPKQKTIQLLVLIPLLFLVARFDYYILQDPSRAPLPTSDYHQYISDSPSGYGLKTVFNFLDQELAHGPPITLVTQGKFGLFPYAFMLTYWDDKRIAIVQSWIPEKIDFDLYAFEKSSKVYVVFKDYEQVPSNLPLRMVLKAEKPGGKHSMLLTELK